MKNSPEWLKSNVDEAEERPSELEDRSIEMIKPEEQKEKGEDKLKEIERPSGVPKEEREKGIERIFKT